MSRYLGTIIVHLITLMLLLTLASCDNPSKNLKNFKPEGFKVTLTEGGKLLVNGKKYKEEDDHLSKLINLELHAKKEDVSYKAIYSYLIKNNHHYKYSEFPDIPRNHVIIAYISFVDSENEMQNISIGKHWLSYFVKEDFFGETSAEVYVASEENNRNLLMLLYPQMKPKLL